MTAVSEHYANHLGPVYVWMAGGLESALERGAAEIKVLSLAPAGSGCAVDLGAGFGMHAIPLARRGFSVLAIDTCSTLLKELKEHSGGLPIAPVDDDLLRFAAHLDGEAELVLCMGDTITHLPTTEAVNELIGKVSDALRPGGQFILTFRDYSSPLEGEQRFIPVRSDENRILTCFLEYADRYVTVHDILHERQDKDWKLSVSSYKKLRLSPSRLENALQSAGLETRREPGQSGMVRIIARKEARS
jgi:SAM-dependent methyltransferase